MDEEVIGGLCDFVGLDYAVDVKGDSILGVHMSVNAARKSACATADFVLVPLHVYIFACYQQFY